jgi:hypothetical protein
MLSRTGRFLIPALFLSGLALVGAATASPKVDYKKVKDEAGFFKPETIDKVNAIVKEIKEQAGKDFFVETFPAVSPEYAKQVKGVTQATRERAFQQWAEERAKIADVDGVYALICKEPPHCSLWVSPDLRNRFRDAELAHLAKLLPPRGWTHTYDTRFVEAAKYVQQVLAAPPPPPAPEVATPWVLIWFSGGLLALVGVLVIFRAATGRHPQHADGQPASGAPAGHHSTILSVGGGPIGMASGHTLPPLPFRSEDEPERRMADGSAGDGLAETQPLSRPEESGRGDEAGER